jgi:hypothetical protein
MYMHISKCKNDKIKGEGKKKKVERGKEKKLEKEK